MTDSECQIVTSSSLQEKAVSRQRCASLEARLEETARQSQEAVAELEERVKQGSEDLLRVQGKLDTERSMTRELKEVLRSSITHALVLLSPPTLPSPRQPPGPMFAPSLGA